MKLRITDALQVSAAILITAGLVAYAEPVAQNEAPEASQSVSETKAVQEPTRVAETLKALPEQSKEPISDPNNCEPQQYWAKEAPHECLTKTTNRSAGAVATTSQPASATSGGCDIAYNNIMRAICLGESGGNSNAVGDNYTIAGLHAPSCGLWQIRTLKGRPTCEELKNPQTNLEWAWKISNQGTNWNPWTVYGSGAYLRHL